MSWTGVGAALGVGKETTWGTSVSRTHWYELVSESLAEQHDVVPRNNLTQAALSRLPRAHYKAGISAGGSVTILACYEGQGPLVQALLGGTPATTGPSGAFYDHTIRLARTLPQGLTLQTQRGNGSSEIFPGSMISKGVLRIETGKEATWVFDAISKMSSGRDTAVSPVWTTARDTVILPDQAGTITAVGGTWSCAAIELAIDNKLSRRNKLGSLYTARPDTSSMLDVQIKMTVDYENDDAYDAMQANTEGDFSVVFTDSDGRTLTIEGNLCRVASDSAPVNTAGIIREEIVLVPKGTDEDSGVVLTYHNKQATFLTA